MRAHGRRLLSRKTQEQISALDLPILIDRCSAQIETIPTDHRQDFEALIRAVKVISDALLTDSNNSSLPPSQDPFRDKHKKPDGTGQGRRRPGAQPGHPGSHLRHAEPTRIVSLQVDRSQIPPDRELTPLAPIKRQVFNINITREVIEYQAEVLIDQYGNRYVADFPAHVKAYAQYDSGLKAYVTALSIHQLIPYERLAMHMNEACNIPLSAGSIRNFIREAAQKLKLFEIWLKTILVTLEVLFTDMTSFNVSGKQKYISIYCDENFTYLVPHETKGDKAVQEVGILPLLKENQVAMHDCDPTYFKYPCRHAACGAHLLRDLRAVVQKDGLRWPLHMENLLKEALAEQEVPPEQRNTIAYYRKWYRSVLTKGENETKEWKRQHRLSDGNDLKDNLTSDTLLKRLRKYENAYLRFIECEQVAFTNNISERGLRPIKLRNKISGCVKNIPSAEDICLLMSYIDTSRKHGLTAEEALKILFDGSMPSFVDLSKANRSLFEKATETSAQEANENVPQNIDI